MIASVESAPSGESVIQTGSVMIVFRFRSRENLQEAVFDGVKLNSSDPARPWPGLRFTSPKP